MTQFAVLHIQKGTGNGGAIGRHIDRVGKQKNNIDQERSHLNRKYSYNPQDRSWSVNALQGVNNLANKVQKRIIEGKTDGKTIRKDAVKYVSVLLSMSHDAVIRNINEWAGENYVFLAKEFGLKNIVDFTVHLDERTPHIHATIVPITRDGRLSAKEIIGNRKNLTRLQTNYAESMAKFGLQRGHHYSPGESVPRHVDVNEYYEILANPPKELQLNVDNEISSEFKAILAHFQEKKKLRVAEEKKAEIEKKKGQKRKRGFRL